MLLFFTRNSSEFSHHVEFLEQLTWTLEILMNTSCRWRVLEPKNVFRLTKAWIKLVCFEILQWVFSVIFSLLDHELTLIRLEKLNFDLKYWIFINLKSKKGKDYVAVLALCRQIPAPFVVRHFSNNLRRPPAPSPFQSLTLQMFSTGVRAALTGQTASSLHLVIRQNKRRSGHSSRVVGTFLKHRRFISLTHSTVGRFMESSLC